jgi:hypothetical protein
LSDIELLIQDNVKGDIYNISDLVEGSITWNTERSGGASKLEFNVINDNKIAFYEGSVVRFKYKKNPIFYGYVFSKSSNKDNIIKVSAYDQLRYFKNKETYVFENKKAGDILKKIASDFNLKTGIIEDTGYVIPSMIEEDKTLLDIQYKANDLTLVSTKKLYVLYDDFGKICLRNVENLKTDFGVDGNHNLTDFNYSTSIDEDTANQIKLIKNNKDSGIKEIYIVKDSNNIQKWGILQYYETVDESLNDAQITDRANQTLSLYNRISKKLSIPVLGDIRARAGFSIFINSITLYDMKINKQYMLIESAKHSFSNNNYTMELELRII